MKLPKRLGNIVIGGWGKNGVLWQEPYQDHFPRKLQLIQMCYDVLQQHCYWGAGGGKGPCD